MGHQFVTGILHYLLKIMSISFRYWINDESAYSRCKLNCQIILCFYKKIFKWTVDIFATCIKNVVKRIHNHLKKEEEQIHNKLFQQAGVGGGAGGGGGGKQATFAVIFSRFVFTIITFCFGAGICDLVHDVQTIFKRCYRLTASCNLF